MLQKLQFKPGIIRNITTLANEGGWYSCNLVRFRTGFPEKIGGWARISASVYQGVCRSLASWQTLAGVIQTGVGTHLKMYVEGGGNYNDITPIRSTATIAANAFTTLISTAIVEVNDVAHGAITGDFVTISGSLTDVGGIPAASFNGEFQITYVDADNYTIVVGATASGSATGGNGVFNYQLNVGNELSTTSSGTYGTGTYGSGVWGASVASTEMRVWTQVPYGELLVFGPRGGAPYLWTPNATPTTYDRGVALASLPGASSVPLYQFQMLFAQAARILVLFSTNSYSDSVYDPLMVRWSDAESLVEWAPAITNQAGEYRLPTGSNIVSAINLRQEIFILTDTSAYTMQYVGAPFVFSFTQQSGNISVISPYGIIEANGVAYWMGHDKFYMFDGRVQTLDCPVSDQVYDDINRSQGQQIFAGTNEGFSEVWWFYPSESSTQPDRYVVYNYGENLWFYGSLTRSAWLDTGLKQGPLAATYVSNVVMHEYGLDDNSTAATVAMEDFIQSADFDIGDGHNLGFVRRILPDVTFTGSTATTPTLDFTVRTRNNPGAPYNAEVTQTVSQTSTTDVEQFTQQLFMRARGRQMSLRVASGATGVHWKLGTPRLDVRPDGRRA
jgi:hypothetical protein